MKNKYQLVNTGSIIKSRSINQFAQIPNTTARQKDLSLKAKGLLLVIMSLPDDWALYKTNLHQYSGDGKDATISAFNELMEKGYIFGKQLRNDKGQLIGWNYIVYDIPQNNPIPENPVLDISILENPA